MDFRNIARASKVKMMGGQSAMKTVDEDQKIKERLISFQTQVESTEGKLFPIWEPIAFTRQRPS
mgnify:CR=1 FL=1